MASETRTHLRGIVVDVVVEADELFRMPPDVVQLSDHSGDVGPDHLESDFALIQFLKNTKSKTINGKLRNEGVPSTKPTAVIGGETVEAVFANAGVHSGWVTSPKP